MHSPPTVQPNGPKPHMEHIMEECFSRQLQLVGDRAHACQNFEWAKETETELAAALGGQGGHRAMQQPALDPLPDPILHVAVVVIVVGEPVDDRQDDRFVIDAGKTFHEVHGQVGPHNGGHIERRKQAGQVEML
jgi:hypothetical protein